MFLKKQPIYSVKVFFVGFLFISLQIGYAQVQNESELYKTILSKDSLLFNVGFNTCDISQFDILLAEDFEFSHAKNSI